MACDCLLGCLPGRGIGKVHPQGTEQPQSHVVCLNDPSANRELHPHDSNSIQTTKYTFLTFLPKNLFEQFRRVANFYFLIIAVIQLIPNVSPVAPWSSIVPLILVISFTSVKEGWEDYNRGKADKDINGSITKVYDGETGNYKERMWKDVRVGEIIELKEDDPVPADMVVLWSSEKHNIFYAETSSLDGETNLKIRQAVPTEIVSDINSIRNVEGFVECDHPNNRLYEFTGNISLRQKGGDAFEMKAVSLTSTLWRGMILRNTKRAIGVVVYSGHDTKLMRNAREPPSKITRVEIIVNNQIIILLCILCCLSFFCAMMGGGYLKSNSEFVTAFLDWDPNIAEQSFLGILTFIILFNVLIPISLYVSVEMVKLAQAWLINFDINMYCCESDTPSQSRTSGLGEELGLIDYIFSDKTGTLTCNEMAFRLCAIGNTEFGGVSKEWDNALPHINCLGENSNFPDCLQQLLKEFYTMLAICNTIIPEMPDGETSLDSIIFKGQSPDETALAKAARLVGLTITDRTYNKCMVNVGGKEVTFDILNVLQFNSTRKRMSIVVRDGDKIKVYCKGADSVILPLLNETHKKEITCKPMVENLECSNDVHIIEQHMHHFACQGLRTLVFAYKELSEEEYQEWSLRYREAETSLQDRAAKVDAISKELELNLSLIGCTAIEDKLQEGVQETLEKLKEADCKIWVLTGDKTETAINIGFSSALLNDGMDVIVINAKNEDDIGVQLRDAIEKVLPVNDSRISFQRMDEKTASWAGYLRVKISQFFSAGKALKVSSIVTEKTQTPCALIIDGESLNYALEPDMRSQFLDFALRCEAVVCCRVSPLQKALVVRLVKNGVNATTLAIGDGANDVSMIQEAHIGVGISGKEGMQAVMASDYSIAQFKFLARLLLVHGYWSYTRLVKMISYFFYKNITFALVQLWYGFFNMFSGQTIYDDYYMAVFNVFFTSLPVMALAIFEQVVPDAVLLLYPQLYSLNRGGKTFNSKIFWSWQLDAFYQSLILYFLPYAAFDNTSPQTDGEMMGVWSLGTVMYTCVLITVNMRMAMITKYWTVFNWITIFGSIIFWFIFAVAYHSMLTLFPNVYSVIFFLLGSSSFWFTIIVTPLVALLPSMVFIAYTELFTPTSDIVLREQFRINGLSYVVENKMKDLMEASNMRGSLMLGQGNEMEGALKELGVVERNSNASASNSGRKKSSVYFAGSHKESEATGFAFSFELPNWDSYQREKSNPQMSDNHTLSETTQLQPLSVKAEEEADSHTTNGSEVGVEEAAGEEHTGMNDIKVEEV